MFKKLNIWKNVRNLLLRYILICMFMFMCVVVIAMQPKILGPILGIFYFIALIYYFWYTMKAEGELDVNRVSIGQMPYFRFKGALCAVILVIPLMILNIIPNFFTDPTPEVYKTYFNGEITVLTPNSEFNQDLRRASGKEGYISEILFTEDRDIQKLVYVTGDGQYSVKCDGTVKDTAQIYAAAPRMLTLSGKDGTDVVYYTEFENALKEKYSEVKISMDGDADETMKAVMSEQDFATVLAFRECRNAIDDIVDVLGTAPNYQKIFSVAKVVLAICLQYFCQIFVGASNPAGASAVYCVCLLVLCIAAQIGYEMGYRNIKLMSRKRPEKNSKAGSSVTIQGRSK